jgi:hypothetical protein
MSKFASALKSVFEDMALGTPAPQAGNSAATASAPTATGPVATSNPPNQTLTPSPSTGAQPNPLKAAAAVTGAKPNLQANDPNLLAFAKSQNLNPQDVYKALTSSATTHQPNVP